MPKPIASPTAPARSRSARALPATAARDHRAIAFASLLGAPTKGLGGGGAAAQRTTRSEAEPADRPEVLDGVRREDDRDARDGRDHGPRELDRTLDGEILAPFVPPPAVLTRPAAAVVEARRSATDVAARLDAATHAERLIRSMRVGRVGEGHEVRLRLAVAAGHGDVEVRLRHEGGELRATLIAHDGGQGATTLADALAQELAARGLSPSAIDVER